MTAPGDPRLLLEYAAGRLTADAQVLIGRHTARTRSRERTPTEIYEKAGNPLQAADGAHAIAEPVEL